MQLAPLFSNKIEKEEGETEYIDVLERVGAIQKDKRIEAIDRMRDNAD